MKKQLTDYFRTHKAAWLVPLCCLCLGASLIAQDLSDQYYYMVPFADTTKVVDVRDGNVILSDISKTNGVWQMEHMFFPRAFIWKDAGTWDHVIPKLCLDLTFGRLADGSNIGVAECESVDTHRQEWDYDVHNQSIHPGLGDAKCLDVERSNFSDGTNIQLWDCNGSDAQRWLSIPYRMPSGTTNQIRLAKDDSKCVDVENARTADRTNIQLNTCQGGEAQYFRYDGRRIKMAAATNPDKCISMEPTGPAPGYIRTFNVVVLECTKNNFQEWYYDGFAKAFRWALDLNICLNVENNSTDAGANIQMTDCDGSEGQQFEIR